MLTAVKIIFLLGFLVIIHELGHYIMAKKCKIKVNEFSIGFGPIIFHKQGKETNYELRLIPLGGFVNLEGEAEHSEKEGSFTKASIPKKIAVMAAGGCVNILFGIIVYFILISIRYGIIENATAFKCIQYAANATYQLISATLAGIRDLFLLKVGIKDMVGPVGISNIVAQTSGLVEFIYLLSIISISLGITNLLPFVPLDGGRIVLLLIEAIRKKQLKQETELKIQSIGFFILIMLSIIVTYNDILNIIR